MSSRVPRTGLLHVGCLAQGCSGSVGHAGPEDARDTAQGESIWQGLPERHPRLLVLSVSGEAQPMTMGRFSWGTPGPVHPQIRGSPAPLSLISLERGDWDFGRRRWLSLIPSAHTLCPYLSFLSTPRSACWCQKRGWVRKSPPSSVESQRTSDWVHRGPLSPYCVPGDELGRGARRWRSPGKAEREASEPA